MDQPTWFMKNNEAKGCGCLSIIGSGLVTVAMFVIVGLFVGLIQTCSTSPEQEAVNEAQENVDHWEWVVKNGQEELDGYRYAGAYGNREEAMKFLLVSPIVQEDEQKLAEARQKLAEAQAALEHRSLPAPTPTSTPVVKVEQTDPQQSEKLRAELTKSQLEIRQQWQAAIAENTPTSQATPVPTPLATPVPTPIPEPTPEVTVQAAPEPESTPEPTPTPRPLRAEPVAPKAEPVAPKVNMARVAREAELHHMSPEQYLEIMTRKGGLRRLQ